MTTPKKPGWYKDPEVPNTQRYWDGQGWTPQRQKRPSLASRSKRWLTLAGIALILTVAALVAGRVYFETFLPGLLIVAAIAAIAAAVTIRSGQSAQRKAITVTAIVVIVAAAIPASLKVVYPVYHHFFKTTSGETPRHSPGSQQASGPDSGPNSDSAPSSGGATSGILVIPNATNGQGKRTYGYIDPDSGSYSEIASFDIHNFPNVSAGAVAVSPDFTKLAVTQSSQGHQNAGWIDTSGNFTNVTPTADPGPFGGSPPISQSIGFDGSGNFYYTTIGATSTGSKTTVYKLAAGSTSGAETTPDTRVASPAGLDYDGSMMVQCPAVNWLGPNNIVSAVGSQVTKYAVTRENGCPIQDYSSTSPLLPTANTANVSEGVGNHDGTRVAFKYFGDNTQLLYTVATDGSSQPTQVNVSGLQVSSMEIIGWR